MSCYKKTYLFLIIFSTLSFICNCKSHACGSFEEEVPFIASITQGSNSSIIEIDSQFLEYLPSIMKDIESLESIAILWCWTLKGQNIQPYMPLIESRCAKIVFTGAHMLQGKTLELLLNTKAIELVITGAHSINNSHGKILAELIEQGKTITITGSSLFGNDPEQQGRLILTDEIVNLLKKLQ